MRQAVLILAALVASLCGSGVASAWPDKPVTITVGFGAGGTTDIVARAVGEVVAKRLGQPVVIENRPGAGGAVASVAATKQKPDGYNLVALTSTTVTLDPLVSSLGYSLDDFTPVAAVGEFPEAFIALPSKGWTTLADVLAAAKSKNARLTYASNTTLDRMITGAIGKRAGVIFTPLPTRGGSEVVTQVMGGHVEVGYSSGAYYPQAKAGDVKALAVLGEKRLAGLPDVPTLKELGYELSSVNLIVFLAPKGLPADVRVTLETAFAEAGRDKAVASLLESRSVSDVVETGAVLDATLRRHAVDFRRLIEVSK